MEYKLRTAGNRNMGVAIIVLLFMTITAMALAWRIYGDNKELTDKLLNNRQTIIVPYGADTPFSFTGERGDARYLRLMALAWLNLRLNINSDNAQASHSMLIASACDGSEKELKPVLAQEAARVAGNSGSSVFYPKDLNVWTDKGVVDITGDLVLTYGLNAAEPVHKHYRLRTDTRNNRLCWSAFLEVADE
ncbi:TraE/TraK family type IV conjugative transfer system protein [Erwinia sp. INIA-01]|uniref:TraE/TraK family type IV conjugative transfer system protein n=1 Tax=Erwinia sp. INIA01 TaxID=2991500 RepID=UPI002225081D|nr:TraE/TraK family type IV conjugative transfer system protein [Erwinia sp. INIA01]MCW1877184.1 TraE/TraK family type IV conjugative transfer system protein [Erwinia sp. INIA01]